LELRGEENCTANIAATAKAKCHAAKAKRGVKNRVKNKLVIPKPSVKNKLLTPKPNTMFLKPCINNKLPI
jgi:hypothetical protein